MRASWGEAASSSAEEAGRRERAQRAAGQMGQVAVGPAHAWVMYTAQAPVLGSVMPGAAAVSLCSSQGRPTPSTWTQAADSTLQQREHFVRLAFQRPLEVTLASACAGQLPAGSTPDSPMAAKVLAAQQRKSRFHPSHAAPSSSLAGAGAGPCQPAQAAATPHKAVARSDQLTPGSGPARRSLGPANGSDLRQAPGSSQRVSGSRAALLATPGRMPGPGGQASSVRARRDRHEELDCFPSSQAVPCCH